MSRNSRIIALAALSGFAAATLAAFPASAGKTTCHPYAVSVQGAQHTSKPKARDLARSAWESHVYSTIAPAYSSWSRAKSSDVSCVQIGKWPSRDWKCTATATPCMKN